MVHKSERRGNPLIMWQNIGTWKKFKDYSEVSFCYICGLWCKSTVCERSEQQVKVWCFLQLESNTNLLNSTVLQMEKAAEARNKIER